MKKLFIIPVLLCTMFSGLFAQKDAVENLPKYYSEYLHFGFTLGINGTNFVLHPATDFHKFDTLKVVEADGQVGFNLGIISELRLQEYLTLRFMPALSFAQRDLNYSFMGVDTFVALKKVESTFIDFPVDIKLRSKRLNNFAAYVVGGGKYSLDLASQKDVQNKDLTTAIVKIKKHDWGIQGGFGVDFFLPYFKFAIEAKMYLGLRDMLVRDETIFSQSIDRLNSKIFLLSFTFEG